MLLFYSSVLLAPKQTITTLRNNSTAAKSRPRKKRKKPPLCVGAYLKSYTITQQERRPCSELRERLLTLRTAEGQIESTDSE